MATHNATSVTEPTDQPIIIRAARREDIPAIAALIRPYVERGVLLARTLDELEELLPGFIVAAMPDESGGERLVGCVTLEVYSRKLAEVRSLAVDAAMQGMGIGRRLVEACIARARELHIFEVMAVTSEDAFFQSCGFDYTLNKVKRALFIQTRDHYLDE